MEDFIFILIAIGWLLYSFFYGKKKKEAQQDQQEYDEDYYSEEQEPSQRDSSSFFESLFTDEEEVKTEQPQKSYWGRERASDYTPVSGDDTYLDSESKEQGIEGRMKSHDKGFIPLDDKIIKKEEEYIEGESLLEDELSDYEREETTSRQTLEFDLRKAVIFSEILKRPY